MNAKKVLSDTNILIYIIAVGSLYSLLVSLFLRNIVVEKER